MKFNQLVDDAAEKIEVARAVNFAQLRAQFSKLRTEYNDYFNKLFVLTAKISPCTALTGVT